MKMMKWMAVGLTCLAAGAMAQAPAAGGGAEAPKDAPRRMGPMGMDAEGLIMRALQPDSPIAKEIGLTEQQAQELKKLVPAMQKDMQDSRDKMEALAMKQADLMSQDSPDEAAVMKVVEELGQMRTDIAKKRMQQVLAAQKILTPEQRTKLRENMKARMEQFRSNRGMGMREGGARRPHPDAKAPEAKAPDAPAKTE